MIVKVGQVKQVFHDAGVKRVSAIAVAIIDEAVGRVVAQMAKDVGKVYPGRLVESADLIRVAKVKGGYMVVLKEQVDVGLDLDALLLDEQVPDDFNGSTEE